MHMHRPCKIYTIDDSRDSHGQTMPGSYTNEHGMKKVET